RARRRWLLGLAADRNCELWLQDVYMKVLLIAVVALSLCSCASIDYTAYSGQQQNWPVASGSFVQTKFALPVYINGPPERPYRVLGYIQVENATRGSASIKSAVNEAAKHGADAVILLES